MRPYLHAIGSGPAWFRRALLLACALMLAAGVADLWPLPEAALREQAAAWLWPARLSHGLRAWLSLRDAALLAFAALMLLFMLALWRCLSKEAPPWRWWPWLAAQMLIAAVLEPWTEPGLGYLVAAELAFLLPWRGAAAGALLQAGLIDAALLPYLARVGDGHPACNIAGALPPPFWTVAALDWLQGLVFQAFAFCVGYGWSEALRGRHRQAQANAELQATQLLLTEAVREAERARIAEGLGRLAADQLAALQLQLRLAEAKLGGEADERIAAARAGANRLLEELRGASRVEAAASMDLRAALNTLCRGIPMPLVRLDMEDKLTLNEPALAHAIFRSVQEALSNALRHSGAARAVVRLERSGAGVAVTVSDNGKGLAAPEANQAGNGLTGMRERVEERGGTLDILSPASGGCCLRIWLPLSSEAS
ncbi:sensor histidine kinase [Chromobacterium sphagni]|nr:ATP-binding protein [Chromobacterium sphagni]